MKIKFGALVTDGRGKIGGHVASRNRAGAYLRTKVTPVNPNTSYQVAARERLGSFSQAWRDLSQSERDAWSAAVGSFAKTDIFGDLKDPAGINLYVKLNANLSEVGAAAITNPPLPIAVVGPTSFTVSAYETTPSFSISWAGGAVPTDTTWIVRVTPQLSPGISFVKNRYRNLSLLVAADTSPEDLLAVYTARFGTPIAGQKIYAEIVPVSSVTGQKGLPLTSSVIVGA